MLSFSIKCNRVKSRSMPIIIIIIIIIIMYRWLVFISVKCFAMVFANTMTEFRRITFAKTIVKFGPP